MLFKKRKIEVKFVDDEPMTQDEIVRKYYPDVAIVEALAGGTKYIVGGLIAYKTATTALRMAEHLVVTKL